MSAAVTESLTGRKGHSPISANLNLRLPNLGIKSLGPVFDPDIAILVVNNIAKTIPDQDSRNSNADEQPDQRYDFDPLLGRISGLLDPGLDNFIFADATAVEVP